MNRNTPVSNTLPSVLHKSLAVSLVVVLVAYATPTGAQIFVTNTGNLVAGVGTIGEYTTSGATVNASLIAGLDLPYGIAVSNGHLYVTNEGGSSGNGSIGDYTTSGVPVNPSLIKGLSFPFGLAVSGNDLFETNDLSGSVGKYTTAGATVSDGVIAGLTNPYPSPAISGSNLFVADFVDGSHGTIGEYTTSGTSINSALITGLVSVGGVAVSGSDLFVTDFTQGTIGEYTTSGVTVNASLVSGLVQPYGIAVYGGDLFVTNDFSKISEYSTSGAIVNASLVTGLSNPDNIVVVVEPSALVLSLVAALSLTAFVRKPLWFYSHRANANHATAT